MIDSYEIARTYRSNSPHGSSRSTCTGSTPDEDHEFQKPLLVQATSILMFSKFTQMTSPIHIINTARNFRLFQQIPRNSTSHCCPAHFWNLIWPQHPRSCADPSVRPRMFSLSLIQQLLFLFALCVLSHPGAAQGGKPITCDVDFHWDLHATATCTPFGDQTYKCNPSSCTFAGQPLTRTTFVYHHCTYPDGYGPDPPVDVMVEWFHNNHTELAGYPLDVFGTAGGTTTRWTCPLYAGQNPDRPLCTSCWP